MPLAKQVGNQNDASTELNLSHILIPLPENPTSDQAAEAESGRALSLSRRVMAMTSASWRSPIPLTSRR